MIKRLSLAAFALASSSALADVQYSLSVDEPAKSVRISIRVKPQGDSTKFVIPSWCPGFYVLKDYDSKVFDFRARDASGKELEVLRNGSEWTVSGAEGKEIIASYRVLGDDGGLGFFGTNVRPKMAFVNGPSAFMYVDGRKTEKAFLDINAPDGWSVATAMETEPKGEFVAGDYDELLDHPIQLGAMQKKAFIVADIPFEVAVASINGRYPNIDALAKNLAALSEPAIQMFGGAPFKKYLYLIHMGVGDFAGGLEHRASTTIAMDFEDPLELGTLAIHEFFHSWNVKQIRPEALGPFDYTKKVRTRNLWWSEGVTDYYANIHARPAGHYGEEEMIAAIGYEIDSLQSSRTRLSKTLEDVCWNTWESSGFGFGDLSYYTKGLVVGLVLDAAIIDATNGAKNLDDVMRLMYERYRLPKQGFGEDDIRKAINEVAGTDLSTVYNQCVRSTNELPYELLPKIGLEAYRPDSLQDALGSMNPSSESVVVTTGAFGLRRSPNSTNRANQLYKKWLR